VTVRITDSGGSGDACVSGGGGGAALEDCVGAGGFESSSDWAHEDVTVRATIAMISMSAGANTFAPRAVVPDAKTPIMELRKPFDARPSRIHFTLAFVCASRNHFFRPRACE